MPSPTASEWANPSASSRGGGSDEVDGVGDADGESVGEADWLADGLADDAASAGAGEGVVETPALRGRAKPGRRPQMRTPAMTMRTTATTAMAP